MVRFVSAYSYVTKFRQDSHCGCANIIFAIVGHDSINMDLFAFEGGSVTIIFES